MTNWDAILDYDFLGDDVIIPGAAVILKRAQDEANEYDKKLKEGKSEMSTKNNISDHWLLDMLKKQEKKFEIALRNQAHKFQKEIENRMQCMNYNYKQLEDKIAILGNNLHIANERLRGLERPEISDAKGILSVISKLEAKVDRQLNEVEKQINIHGKQIRSLDSFISFNKKFVQGIIEEEISKGAIASGQKLQAYEHRLHVFMSNIEEWKKQNLMNDKIRFCEKIDNEIKNLKSMLNEEIFARKAVCKALKERGEKDEERLTKALEHGNAGKIELNNGLNRFANNMADRIDGLDDSITDLEEKNTDINVMVEQLSKELKELLLPKPDNIQPWLNGKLSLIEIAIKDSQNEIIKIKNNSILKTMNEVIKLSSESKEGNGIFYNDKLREEVDKIKEDLKRERVKRENGFRAIAHEHSEMQNRWREYYIEQCADYKVPNSQLTALTEQARKFEERISLIERHIGYEKWKLHQDPSLSYICKNPYNKEDLQKMGIKNEEERSIY